jgi:hypothetical protein
MLLHLQRRGLPVAALHRATGVPLRTLYGWLAGRTDPNPMFWGNLQRECPSCVTNPHPMGKALVRRYRESGTDLTLAVWLAEVSNA